MRCETWCVEVLPDAGERERGQEAGAREDVQDMGAGVPDQEVVKKERGAEP